MIKTFISYSGKTNANIKPGDCLTIKGMIVDNSGGVIFNAGDKVKAVAFEIKKGYWSNIISGHYYPDEILSVKLEGQIGISYLPSTFIEFQDKKSLEIVAYKAE